MTACAMIFIFFYYCLAVFLLSVYSTTVPGALD
jgi:hypothetical protein